MAITDVFVPDAHFGRPGALIALPWPLGNLPKEATRSASDFVTGSGVHRVTRLLRGTRLYSVQWDNLRYDTFAKVEAYHLGHNGLGPWAFVDPSAINLLTAHQSGATSDRNEVAGFSTSAADHGSLVSNANATYIHRTGAPRSLQWSWPVAAAASPRLDFSTVYTGWHGVPCVVGKSYTYSLWVRPDNTVDGSIQFEAKMQWRDAAGATVGSEASGGVVTVTGWTRLVCTAVAPAGAAYVSPRLMAVGSTITTGASAYVDEMQLEISTAVTDWRPGNGVYPVSIVSLSEVVPWAATWRIGPQLVLREVG